VAPGSGSAYWEITNDTTTSGAATQTAHEVYRLGPFGHPGARVFGYSNGVDPDRVYAYDARGNPADADAEGCGNRREFNYDSEGSRLLRVVRSHCDAPDDVATYSYDEAGYTTSRNGLPITWTADGRIATFGDDTFEWDLLGRPVSWSVAGELQSWALFGGRVGDTGALDLGEVSIPLWGDAVRYRHLDFRGNVSFVTDGPGAVVQHFRYHPYGVDGELLGGQGERVSFAGRRQIGELMVLGERIYDAEVGRFLSPDPVFHWVNAYSYTLGNPVWFWDRDGAQAAPASGSTVESAAIDFAVASVGLASAVAVAAVGPPAVGVPVLAAAIVNFVWRAEQLRLAIVAERQRIEPIPNVPAVTPGPAIGGGGPVIPSGSFCGLGGPEIMLAMLALLCSRRVRRRVRRLSCPR
jgi:RHS repeat-associated protein